MNRRTFLKATAAAFPLIATSCTRLRGPMAPSNSVQIAAIGIGGRDKSVKINKID